MQSKIALGGFYMLPFYEFQPEEIKIINNRREINYRAHTHKQLEIVYVFSQGQHMDIDGEKYEIDAGQAAVIFPFVPHEYYRNEWRDTEHILIIIPTELFGSILPDFNDVAAQNPIITDIDDITRTAFKEIINCTENAEKIAWAILIVSRLTKKLSLKRKEHLPVANLTQKIVLYIGENFQDDITLDTLAKEFNVSKFYISHTFSNSIKMSLPNYLALVRSEYAAEQLRTTNYSVTAISNDAGFNSQSTFNRAFKRIYNMTPAEYRERFGGFYKA